MRHRDNNSERGQVLPIMAMLLLALLGVTALAIDAGRLYVARAELSRALDAAALAGVIELPDEEAAMSRASAYLLANQPDAQVNFPAQQPNQLRVQGTRRVDFLFMRVLGVDSMNVQNTAAAGIGLVPSDTVVMVDATGSMGASPCNGSQNNAGCPIWEAKVASHNFTDLLMNGSSLTQVGFSPFRGCHNPPRTQTGCVTNSMRVDLTYNSSFVHSAITNSGSVGGTGTNVCLGFWKAMEMFNGPNHQTAPNTLRSVVILSDGDNTYNVVSYDSGQNAPPLECRPSSPTASDTYVGSNCSAPGQGAASGSNPGSISLSRERSMDIKSKAFADSMRAQGIEIYIIAFGVCGTLNGSTATSAYCANIGNADPDTLADQRLLKCMASSTPGTNDHYYAVTNASQLPAVFETVANAIAFRLIE